jgi:hypothetical protein
MLYEAAPVFGSETNSPNSNGWTGELSYIPWQNVKILLQYTRYHRFNGASMNYDGTGGEQQYDLGWLAFGRQQSKRSRPDMTLFAWLGINRGGCVRFGRWYAQQPDVRTLAARVRDMPGRGQYLPVVPTSGPAQDTFDQLKAFGPLMIRWQAYRGMASQLSAMRTSAIVALFEQNLLKRHPKLKGGLRIVEQGVAAVISGVRHVPGRRPGHARCPHGQHVDNAQATGDVQAEFRPGMGPIMHTSPPG